MGQHHSNLNPNERRGYNKESVTAGSAKIDGRPIIIDHSKALKTQMSEDDHEPKSPEPREDLLKFTKEENRKLLPCVIKWNGGGQNVQLAGSFNNWRKIPMVKSEKDFVAIVNLAEGDFEYKFEVDGEWKLSANDESAQNPDGIENNVITIDESHFAELEKELLNDPNDLVGDDSFATMPSQSSKPAKLEDEGYGQMVPEYQTTDKVKDPPVLPPHLLQVILNKDTPVSCEPTLLPEPNHVIVNHMYALSIRDGMMVLSTTHRYKKKSVTTLIYRPISG